ncbi:MAG: hypothetical protein L0177_01030 [Chloroflexi bacterium]|nr:hypothetical protein [Chloroflexota bacterium]
MYSIPLMAVGNPAPARDLNGDGLAEDVNGNGRLDFGDVTALLLRLGSRDSCLDASAFDFDGDGSLGASDVAALFYKMLHRDELLGEDVSRDEEEDEGVSKAMNSEESIFFSTVHVDWADTYNTPSDGDLWPSAWSNDGYLYAANGDGKGFNLNGAWSEIVVNRLDGHPDSGNITGVRLSSGDKVGQVWNTRKGPDGVPAYSRKPTGMVSVDGVLYLAVQDLNREPHPKSFNDAPNATIARSTNKGVTWTWDRSAPMFSDYAFTTIMFLDFGQDGVDNVPGSSVDDYVYAYGIDNNWRASFSGTVSDPVSLYLARVHRTADLQDISSWEFYTGDLDGNAAWSSGGDLSARRPVLQDGRRIYSTPLDPGLFPQNHTVISQGSVVYNRPLNRYIYASWTEWTYEFYEAPNPWGPWKRFVTRDFGTYPWFEYKNGGYATVIPSKFISSDGKTMWVQSNTFAGGVQNYNFSLRKITVEPYVSTTASNAKSASNLALPASAPGVMSVSKSAHYGNPAFLNDGNLEQSEDSWDGDGKATDWWGYTWPRQYNMNEVVYAPGKMFGTDGGWFLDIKVQIRQNFDWVDVGDLAVSPSYPGDSKAGSNQTYAFTFAEAAGDGVRIIGTPGGTAKFTSIAELEVYYADPPSASASAGE